MAHPNPRRPRWRTNGVTALADRTGRTCSRGSVGGPQDTLSRLAACQPVWLPFAALKSSPHGALLRDLSAVTGGGSAHP